MRNETHSICQQYIKFCVLRQRTRVERISLLHWKKDWKQQKQKREGEKEKGRDGGKLRILIYNQNTLNEKNYVAPSFYNKMLKIFSEHTNFGLG